MDYRKIITIDPKVRSGQPCVRGLPITVTDVLGCLESGMTADEVTAKHMELSREDVIACLQFAVNDGQH
jgi:uncharacterized protein (DUF433 family)